MGLGVVSVATEWVVSGEFDLQLSRVLCHARPMSVELSPYAS